MQAWVKLAQLALAVEEGGVDGAGKGLLGWPSERHGIGGVAMARNN